MTDEAAAKPRADPQYPEDILRRRDAIHCATAFAAEQFLGLGEFDASVKTALERLGKAVEASRAYVFENGFSDEGTLLTSQRYEWVADHVTPQIENPELQRMPPIERGFARWVEALRGNEIIVGLVREFPETERAALVAQDIVSILVVPVFVAGEWWGFIGFDDCARERIWLPAEIEALRAAATTLGAALLRMQTERELRYLKEFHESIVQGIAEGIVIEDTTGHITFVNPAMGALLGLTSQELVGRHYSEIVARDSRPKAQAETARRPRGISSRYETALLGHADRRVPVLVHARPLFQGGEFVGVLTAFTDLTERRRLEEQLSHSQKMEALGTLAGGIAHDFNNLLGGILGFSSLLERDLPVGTPHGNAVQNITRAARHGAELTGQLLAFATGGTYEVRPINLNDVVAELERLLSRTIDRTIAIDMRLADDLAAVEGDTGQLHQMLLNIFLNACDAMPAGGRLSIETANVILDEESSRSEPDLQPGWHVRIRVGDTGIGIEPQALPRIFEPFFTTKKGRAGKQHTGLGLATVYGIVRRHSGTIRAESTVGQGTTFEIYLPASKRAPAQGTLAAGEALGAGETILVVDDEELIVLLVRQVLEPAGYRVLLARDGIEALEIYRQKGKEIDLVILDMGLPRLDGRDTYKAMREIDPNAAVLISSGYSEDGQAREVLASGGLGFLAKPYDVNALLRRVREVLDRR